MCDGCLFTIYLASLGLPQGRQLLQHWYKYVL